MGQKSRHSFTGSSALGYFAKMKSNISSEGSAGNGFSKLTQVAVGRIDSLVDCWTEGINSSPAIDQRLLSVPCHGSHLTDQFITWGLISLAQA